MNLKLIYIFHRKLQLMLYGKMGLTDKQGLPYVRFKCSINKCKIRGSWMQSKHYLNMLLLIALFYLVFHMTLNSRNTKLKYDGVRWGSLDIQNVLHVNFKTLYFIL